jgi:sugar O-acyltransferase (sialic acid O-acetyltransferase NeuD family)
MIKKLVIFPFGGNAKEAVVVAEAINRIKPEWKIIGFIDDDPKQLGREFNSYKVLGGRSKLDNLYDAYILAVPGRPDNFAKRSKLINYFAEHNQFASLIHPSVEIHQSSFIGRNTLIMSGVVITANVNIGNHCVILPNTVISHDSRIEDYCLIGSNISVSSNVVIEEQSYIGSGTKIIQDIRIGSQSLIGIGSVIIDNIPSKVVAAGSPARIIRKVT